MREDASHPLQRAEVGRALTARLGAPLGEFLPRQRWFASKGRRLTAVRIIEWAPLGDGVDGPWLALAEAGFSEGPPETYAVPLALRTGQRLGPSPIGRIAVGPTSLGVYDLFDDPESCLELLDGFERGSVRTHRGCVRFTRSGVAPDALRRARTGPVRRVTSEQSNSSVVYADVLILKVFRRIEPGPNPEAEISEFLTTRTPFRHVPLLVGAMQYSGPGGVESSLATLQQFVPSDGDGWGFTLDHLRRFHDAVRDHPGPVDPDRMLPLVREVCAGFFGAARRLGTLTAALHVALGSAVDDPVLAPEPISGEDVRRWETLFEDRVIRALDDLHRHCDALPPPLPARARAFLGRRESLVGRARHLSLLTRDGCVKTRIHGDYHLGQTLRTGDDFVILDFEGEPARPLEERRAKQCPLKDVAGMLRSFDYARAAASAGAAAESGAADAGRLERWDVLWGELAREAFLDGYRAAAAESPARLLPGSPGAMASVLEVFELDKALYELRYELNNRPAWVPIPLRGLARLLARGT